MYLFFDTETTGLPKNWKAPITDLDNWPRLVQLAYLIYDQNGRQITEKNFIIKPQGFVISDEAAKIHKISTERAMKEGVELKEVLKDFQNAINQTEFLVAHNMSFDEKIIRAEFLRNNMTDIVATRKKICTMESTTNFCALKGAYGYKWPKLSELYYKLFQTDFEEAHNATFDILATARCFWELKKLKKI